MIKVKYYTGARILVFGGITLILAILKYIFSPFSFLNLILLLIGIVFFVSSIYFKLSPIAEYDENGVVIYPFFKLGNQKEILWKDVKEVYSMKETYSTWVIANSGQAWIIDSGDKINYFDTLKELLKYIPEEKFDELTLKRAKGPKKKYFI